MTKAVGKDDKVEHHDWIAVRSKDQLNDNYRLRSEGATRTFPKPT